MNFEKVDIQFCSNDSRLYIKSREQLSTKERNKEKERES